jgi:hypothetical protein
MESALQKLPVLANDLSPLIHNPIVVYSFLGLYGLLLLLLIAYVHTRFRRAAKALKLLQTEWSSAESKYSNFVGMAQEQLSKLSAPAAKAAPLARPAGLAPDVHNRVVSMANRGIALTDIAQSCSLQEGEVDVILGMARLER